MRVVIQRASSAQVAVDHGPPRAIGRGLVILLGIETADDQTDGEWLAGKIAKLRIFSDDTGQMNRSVVDIAGEILLVSQFTLHASMAKGSRPSFHAAARPEQAKPLYELFIKQLQQVSHRPVITGEFGASMQVSLTNDGPVTIILDSKQRA
jgi:D-aminoacyl-tRNA deacylase